MYGSRIMLLLGQILCIRKTLIVPFKYLDYRLTYTPRPRFIKSSVHYDTLDDDYVSLQEELSRLTMNDKSICPISSTGEYDAHGNRIEKLKSCKTESTFNAAEVWKIRDVTRTGRLVTKTDKCLTVVPFPDRDGAFPAVLKDCSESDENQIFYLNADHDTDPRFGGSNRKKGNRPPEKNKYLRGLRAHSRTLLPFRMHGPSLH